LRIQATYPRPSTEQNEEKKMRRPWGLNATWFRSIRTISSLFLILAVTVAGCGGGDGGDDTSPDDPFVPQRGVNTRILEVDTDGCPEVTVHFSANNQRTSDPIRGLTNQDFQVIEDGSAKVIKEWFELDDVSVPIVFSIVLDYSISVLDEDLLNVEDAAAFFVNELFDLTDPLLSWGQIRKFSRYSALTQEFTDSRNLLLDGIDEPYTGRADKGTDLYGAIYDEIQTITDFRGTRSGLPDRSILVVQTDGRHNPPIPTYSQQDVINAAKAAGVEIFAVGFGDEVALRPLFNIAVATNGLYFYARTSEGLTDINQLILDSLQHQYRVLYDSTESATHTVQIEVITDDLSGSDSRDFECP
jgi:hypothetical protein